jgi:GxxExxY protein
LLESAYEHCLLLELEGRGLGVRRQVPVDLEYRGQVVAGAYRIDLLVEEAVVVEVKAVERMLPLHASQVLTYVRLAGCKVGLLLNFDVDRLADGMKRVVAD